METTTNKLMKTKVFNVIILDKSGSMESIRSAAIDGFNETLAGIKKAQDKYADTQEHFVSLLTFCDCEKKYVFDKEPAAEARKLTRNDYRPCCCTPLYDAMGFTLTSMRNYVAAIEDHVVVVTIITDGLENSSKEYTGAAVKKLVEELKKEGWTFTYMGANQNATEIAFNLSIRNSRNFEATALGTIGAMSKDTSTRMNFFGKLAGLKLSEWDADCPMDESERAVCYSAAADEAFDEEEKKA
ncbi:MAG: VWA domain-containing protein [Bacteroidales bacterium]|nr:VWA domain-containing protein [Bacteroidales bacterium]